ncbi:MAG: filamentous hemagglutinin N-terminal domain-containing protein [Nitrospira sp.]|nr:filamentous hemagglutinin N-terminal domain-containing protein [Nitrospira sp.]
MRSAKQQAVTTTCLLFSLVLCVGFCLTAFGIPPGFAQEPASPMTSSGLNTRISDPTSVAGETQYTITGGTRTGTNLFHSFGDFTIPNDTIANFLNDSGLTTSNVLGRVTGGNPSTILGTIQTTGFGDASLFLMNPAGIVFGPSATLSVGGSVTFMTADHIRFADSARFNAIPSVATDTLLSTAPVAAYGFLGSAPGAITVRGSQLNVLEGHTITLVGGDITIQNGPLGNGSTQPARLSAPQGHINLATTQSPGEFLDSLAAAPNVNGASFRSYGSAHFEPGSILDVRHTGNGQVSIRSGQLVMDIQNAVLDTTDGTAPTANTSPQDTIVLAPGSSIVSRTSSSESGPTITLGADQISLLGHPDTITDQSATSITTFSEGSGHAGSIALRTTGNMGMTDVVNISSTSTSGGNAGNVELSSTHGNIRITNSVNTAVASLTIDSGKTGAVTVSAPEGDIVLDGGNLFTSSSPTSQGGGLLEVSAKNLYMANSSLLSNDSLSRFKPDGIIATLSGKLTMEGGSLIVASSLSDAPSADITLTAKEIVATQRSIINNATFASGPGGQLKIAADTLRVTDDAQLSSGSTKAPNRGALLQILGDISPTGPGGNITIHTLGPSGSILIDGKGSGIFAETEGSGSGGSISLTAAKSISVNHGGVISASSTGATAGNAGNISLDAGQQLDVTNGSSITTATQSPQANGGNIAIRAIDRIRFVDSTISTSVKGTEGSGGNIFIDPKVVVLQGSEITAKAVGGAGGNITFVTPLFLADSASLVSASSERGPSGTVTIQSPTSNLSGAVGQLAAKPGPPQVLLQNHCVAKTSSDQSSFILAGRDALPADPGGWLSSPVAIEHWTGEDVEEHASGLMVRRIRPNQSPALLASMNKGGTLSLRGLTPQGFLVNTFATGPTDCPS